MTQQVSRPIHPAWKVILGLWFFPLGMLGNFAVRVAYMSDIPADTSFLVQLERAAFWFVVIVLIGGVLWLVQPRRFRVVGWVVLMMCAGFAFQVVIALSHG